MSHLRQELRQGVIVRVPLGVGAPLLLLASLRPEVVPPPQYPHHDRLFLHNHRCYHLCHELCIPTTALADPVHTASYMCISISSVFTENPVIAYRYRAHCITGTAHQTLHQGSVVGLFGWPTVCMIIYTDELHCCSCGRPMMRTTRSPEARWSTSRSTLVGTAARTRTLRARSE